MRKSRTGRCALCLSGVCCAGCPAGCPPCMDVRQAATPAAQRPCPIGLQLSPPCRRCELASGCLRLLALRLCRWFVQVQQHASTPASQISQGLAPALLGGRLPNMAASCSSDHAGAWCQVLPFAGHRCAPVLHAGLASRLLRRVATPLAGPTHSIAARHAWSSNRACALRARSQALQSLARGLVRLLLQLLAAPICP